MPKTPPQIDTTEIQPLYAVAWKQHGKLVISGDFQPIPDKLVEAAKSIAGRFGAVHIVEIRVISTHTPDD